MKIVVTLIVFFALFFTTHTKEVTAKIPESYKLTKHDYRQIHCLTKNIYHEARGESEKGKYAVAFVTINRAKSGMFPEDVCAVVKQKIGNTCQFSWFCQTKSLTRPNQEVYNALVPIAFNVYVNYRHMQDPTRGALFYHADYVAPGWGKRFKKTQVIGKHIFYKPKEI